MPVKFYGKNMNTKFIIAIGAAAAAAAYFLKEKKQALENLKVSFLDVYIDSANTNWFDQIAWIFKLKLINSESVAIRVKKIDLDVYINGKKIAEINSSTQITVKANDDEIIRLSTSIKTGNLIVFIADLIADSKPLKINVQGIVSTDLGNININYTKNANL